MSDKKEIGYCGFYCTTCGTNFQNPALANSLKEVLEPIKDYIPHKNEKEKHLFMNFWTYLDKLSKYDVEHCCKTHNCGDPECKIRICAEEREVKLCVDCDEFPCKHFSNMQEMLGDFYSTFISDVNKIKDIGLSKWLDLKDSHKESLLDRLDKLTKELDTLRFYT